MNIQSIDINEFQNINRLHTVKEISEKLGLARATVKKLMDAGELGYVMVGGFRRIPEESVAEWYNKSKVLARGDLLPSESRTKCRSVRGR